MTLSIAESAVGPASFSAEGDTVFLKGTIRDANPGAYLNPFFEQVVGQMGPAIQIDVSKLDFINSSACKALMTFIIKRKANSKLVIKTDTTKTWQAVTLKVMQALDKNNITLV